MSRTIALMLLLTGCSQTDTQQIVDLKQTVQLQQQTINNLAKAQAEQIKINQNMISAVDNIKRTTCYQQKINDRLLGTSFAVPCS